MFCLDKCSDGGTGRAEGEREVAEAQSASAREEESY